MGGVWTLSGLDAARPVDIQVMPARERQLPALPVLTYFKYAPFRFSETAILGSA
ncbi:hypothetical protein OHD62_15655 [Mesorhizobium sp. YC-39]|uniref:hypothetical protein n=1 Tax=unclassified Mesorhizobium TaxID=325217 RepID=UPI0021E7E314|nr:MULTISPECIES: hypothetical protein [unclassified Mesorhizobium]MCV3208078.1 hypothetical protein [Mesorhizobium sp. YC-2]MCV3229805.1 hypothetical protein [Mesorhizobium sp. YC-39]